jgi:hypothetical protein
MWTEEPEVELGEAKDLGLMSGVAPIHSPFRQLTKKP